MDIIFQRWMDRIIGTIFCSIFSLFKRNRKVVNGGNIPRKILVILLSEMGSLVLATPMFENIKKRYGDVPIFALVFEQNREFLEVLNVVSSDNILTVSNASPISFARDSIRVIKKMRRIMIDTVLDCELFSRISSIYAFLSGAKIIAGFHPHTQEGLFRGSFINRPVPYNPYHHISQQFITLVEALESPFVPKGKRFIKDENFSAPRIDLNREEMNEMWARFKIDFPDIVGKELVLLYPSGGLLPIRAWPLNNFCSVAEDLIQNSYAVGIIGLEGDKDLAATILSRCRSSYCLDLTGYTKTVRELVIMFHFASLLISYDGGPGHLASMTPIPTVILYGPETPALYGTLDRKAVQFYIPLSCSPCLTAYNHRNSPCDGDNVCLKSIDDKDVIAKAHEILEIEK